MQLIPIKQKFHLIKTLLEDPEPKEAYLIWGSSQYNIRSRQEAKNKSTIENSTSLSSVVNKMVQAVRMSSKKNKIY